MEACTNRKPLSMWGQGCSKGQKCREPLVSHGKIHLGAHHKSLQSLGHTKVKMLALKVLLKKGNCGLLALGLKVGCSHFCFHPLEMHRRPAGNKTHMEKPVAAHTESSLLARGNATLPRQESAQQTPPSENQQKQHVNTKFTEYIRLQNFRAREK